MFLRGCFVVLLFTASVTTAAQAPYLYFNRITVENGLSHPKVNCIIQDRRGFIWIGTDDGLNRYDGSHFAVFRNRPGLATGISGNMISDILEDNDGVIWIATLDGGLSKYDYRLPPARQFTRYRHDPNDSLSIPVNIINRVLEDKNGYLWLATDGKSVVRFNKQSGTFSVPVTAGTKNAIALCVDASDSLWVGRQGGGLLKIHTGNLGYSMDPRYNNLYAKLPHVTVSSLFRDSKNNIWYGSWDRSVYRYDVVAKQEIAYDSKSGKSSFPPDDILAFAEDANGRLWMAGRYNGLTLFDPSSKQFFNFRHDPAREGTISDNKINCIYVASNGLVWLGTNKGVSVYNPAQHPFTQIFLPTEKNATIHDFTSAPDGKLWIGTSDGLYIMDHRGRFEHRTLTYRSRPLVVSKFFTDQDGTIYIGTDFSLFIYDVETNECRLLPNTEKDPVVHNIINSRIVSIEKDYIMGHPVLLVSPYGHFMAYYDLKDQYWVSRVDTSRQILDRFNLRDNLIRKFYKTKKGRIWLATVKAGLGEWKNNSMPVVQYHRNMPFNTRSISNDHIFDIAEDSSGNLWISTFGGGLNYFDVRKGNFTHIVDVTNLVEGLQVDGRHNVWMISNGHLHRYDPVSRTFRTFLLPDLEKSGGVKGYIYRDAEGTFFLAGNNYFIRFHPDELAAESSDPPVYFTDFKIFNTSYSHLLSSGKITLKHTQNYFTFEFAAPLFDGSNVEYQYKLEGIDRDWINSGNRNSVSYSNLDAGNYVFRVRTAGKNGGGSDNTSGIVVSIVPPFWKTWYFAVLCIGIAGCIIYAVYRYRINELVNRQRIRDRIAQDLHDNVGSTLSSISVYSQVAQIYREQKRNDALAETLERISSTSGEMISEMNDIVWAINPRNDHMSVIVQRMECYARPLLEAKNIAFEFRYDPAILELNTQMEQRNNFYLIFKEAVNNAIKYSGCSHLSVELRLRHRLVHLTVSDNGKGFSPGKINAEASRSMSGNGLRNMKLRAAALRGTCEVDSQENRGTTIRLSFPIT